MKNIYLQFALTLILIQANIFSQKIQTKENFNYLVREENGDLNGDGKTDRVTVHMDTVNKTTL